ncbi:hypothetical protein VaNZ11_005256, partial [Volvox africanus]
MDPLTEETGGLLVRPERPVFKAPPPRTSMLGLDKLAAQKRAELAEREIKRVKLSYEDTDAIANPSADANNHDGGSSGSGMPPPTAPPSSQERRFRGQRSDTPSHPGGVSTAALESLAEHKERQRGRDRSGLYASTSAAAPTAAAGDGGSIREELQRSDARFQEQLERYQRGRDRDRDRDSEGGTSSTRGAQGGGDRDRGRDGYGGNGSSRDRDRYGDHDRGRDASRSSKDRDRREYDDRGRGRDGGDPRYGGGDGGGDRASRPGSGSGFRRSEWDSSTPVRRSGGDDEWALTPVIPSGRAGGGTGSAGSSRAGAARSSYASGGWSGGGDTPLPAAAVPSG